MKEQIQTSGVRHSHRIEREKTGNGLMAEVFTEMRASAQRYLDTVEAIMVSLDTHGRISLVNRKGCELLGYREEEILGKSWFDCFLSGEDRAEVSEVFSGIMNGNIAALKYHENPVTTRNGEERIIAWHNSILRDHGGRIAGVLSYGEDVTDRKRIEETSAKLLSQNRDLTHQLFLIQERERCNLARELHDENSQWLTALRMHAHLLSEHCGSSDARIKSSIRDIQEIASTMQNNIRAIIRRLRAVDLEEMGLADSLQELVHRWQETYPGIHCEFHVHGDFSAIRDVPGITIYRIIQESLTNVAKHAAASFVSVRIRLHHTKRADFSCVLIRVRDNGIGIDRTVTGEGYGLAGMRERVLAVNGTFSVSSPFVNGTLISVRLPVSKTHNKRGHQ